MCSQTIEASHVFAATFSFLYLESRKPHCSPVKRYVYLMHYTHIDTISIDIFTISH